MNAITGNRTFYVYTSIVALGALSAQSVPVLIPAWLCVIAAAALVPLIRITRLRPLVVFVLVVLWAQLRSDLVLGAEWPSTLEGRDVILVGTVANLPQWNERYIKFDLDVERARFGDAPLSFTAPVRLRWYDPPVDQGSRLAAGSTWRLSARLKQPHGYYNPSVYDYEARLFREGVRATGYVRESASNSRLALAESWSLTGMRDRIRGRVQRSLEGARWPGLLRALAMGDRSGIGRSEWRVLRATGTNHLFAISGLHVGLVAAIGGLLGLGAGRLLVIVFPGAVAPRIGALTGLVLAFCYAALSGFAVPAQRAFLMAAVFLLGVLLRRHAWSLRTLCVAFVAVLLLDPASVHDPGLWLSFGAVALILARLAGRADADRTRVEASGSGPGYRRRSAIVLEAIRLQCILSLALIPLVGAFFGVAAPAAPLSNLVAVPVVVFGVVPLCLAGVAITLAGFQDLAVICFSLADLIMDWLWRWLEAIAGLDYALVPLQLEPWQGAVLFAGMLWLCAARPGRRKWALACSVVLLAPPPAAPREGEFRVTVLDVGQGLAAVVRTADHVLVYDTGPRYPGGFSLANAVVIPFLRSKSVSRIDMMMVSHGDNDHRGGFEDLRAAFPMGKISSSVDLPGGEHCVRGQSWRWDGVDFEILHPGDVDVPAHNNASCVLRVSGPHGAMLLTGDIEARAEWALVGRTGAALRSDVLLVPHQGSTTSSTPAFIERVAPRWAVVSAGYRNRYGHPSPEVMDRYARRGIPVKITARDGAVIIEFGPHGISVRNWRAERRRFWLDRDAVAHGKDPI